MNFLLPAVVGALLLAGCTGTGPGQSKDSGQARTLARLHASEKTSLQIEARMSAAQRRLAASYSTGTVTVPGEVVSQNAATDEQNRKLQELRAKLVKSRQEQQRLRAQLREINLRSPAAH